MKKSRKTIKMVAALFMAILLCFGTMSAMAATPEEPPVQKTFSYDNYFTNWAEVYCYAWNETATNAAWPGELMTIKPGSSVWDLAIDTTFDHIIFSNGTDSQTLDLTILENYDTFYSSHMSNGKVNGYWKVFINDYSNYVFSTSGIWGATDCYVSYWGSGLAQQNWPGIKMDSVEGQNTYFVTLPVGLNAMIFNNGGNGKQTVTLYKYALPTNSFGLTGVISGQDEYGNEIYEVRYNPPYPHG